MILLFIFTLTILSLIACGIEAIHSDLVVEAAILDADLRWITVAFIGEY